MSNLSSEDSPRGPEGEVIDAYSSNFPLLVPVAGPLSPSLQFDSQATAQLTELKTFTTSLDIKFFDGSEELFERRALA